MLRNIILWTVLMMVTFVVHIFIWQSTTITDSGVWEKRTNMMAYDLSHGLHFSQDNYSGHPGTSILLPAGFLQIAGLSSSAALRWALPIVLTLILVTFVYQASQLMPGSLWPITAGGVLIFHPLFAQSSPTNAVSSTLFVLALLMVMRVIKLYKPSSVPWHQVALLGVALGSLTATRLPTGGLLTAMIVLFLLFRLKKMAIPIIVGIIAVVSFFVLDPLLWIMPIQHVMHMFSRATVHLTGAETTPLIFSHFLLFAPMALLSIAMSVIFYAFHRVLRSPLDRSLIIFLWILTVIFSSVFLTAESQSLRYFYPLIFLWDAILPMFVLHLIPFISFPFSPPKNRLARAIMLWGVSGIIIFGQLTMLVHTLTLPEWVVVYPISSRI